MSNYIHVTGRLGQDPEIRYDTNNVSEQFPQGTPITNFSLASNFQKGGKDFTDWFKVTTFRKTAELAAQYLTKGRLVQVRGRAEVEKWISKTSGEAMATINVVADDIQFLDSKNNGNGSQVKTGDQPEPAAE